MLTPFAPRLAIILTAGLLSGCLEIRLPTGTTVRGSHQPSPSQPAEFPDMDRPPDLRLPAPAESPDPETLEPLPPASPMPNPTPTPTPAPAPDNFLPTAEAYILERTNAERQKIGLKSLVVNTTLASLARSRSRDMGDRNYFSHTTPEGTNLFHMLRQLGFAYSTAGENIAWNSYPLSTTAQVAMDGWMNSSGHRANILGSGYGRIGIGAYLTAAGRKYYTQVFTN